MDMNPYLPIDCSMHDRLLHFATCRQRVQVEWIAGAERMHRLAVLVDVYTHAGAEFVRLDSGEVIRLDHLVSVDGMRIEGGNSCQV